MPPAVPMRHLLRTLPCVCAALALSCATGKEIIKPDGPLVKDVKIEGAEKLDASDIKGKILTTETSWWSWLPDWVPLSPEEYHFDSNAWQADLRRIERYYQAQGYYQAEVLNEAVTPLGKGAVGVRVAVKEGEPTTISKVEILGLDSIAPEHRAQVVDELPLVAGEIFREDDWAGVKGTIQARLKELGYAEAEVGGEAFVDVAKHTAEVQVEAKPGQRYKFGNIFVATDPNPKVNNKRIIEQAKSEIEKGSWYSESDLADAQARVFKMGVFGGVRVTRGAPDRQAGTVPVVVDVREAPFHSIRAGGGLGADPSRQEVRTVFEYTDRNFLGGLRRFTGRARAGYAALPSFFAATGANTSAEAVKSGPIFDLSAELEQPRFLMPDLRAQGSIEFQRAIEPAYTQIGGQLKVGVIWQPLTNLSVFPSYNLEAYSLSRSGRITGRDLAQNALIFGCREDPCLLSYLEQTVEYDLRDNPVDPKRGFFASLSLQEGGGPLQGSFTYVRLVPEGRAYTTLLNEKLTIAGKLKLGTLITPSNEDSPIVARFFSGGANAMRGFSNRRLSPFTVVERSEPAPTDTVLQVAPVGQLGETIPVGGDSLVEGSVETRYQFFKYVAFALFLDFGTVRPERLQMDDLKMLHYAAGFGIRLKTPVGPIRVDLARRIAGPPLDFPVTRESGTSQTVPPDFAFIPQGSCFGLGRAGADYPGSPEGLCSFHLSIGEAF